MHPLFRKKSRAAALVSVALLAQCCCCILPVGWQVQQESPTFRSMIEKVERTFQIDLGAIEQISLFEE